MGKGAAGCNSKQGMGGLLDEPLADSQRQQLFKPWAAQWDQLSMASTDAIISHAPRILEKLQLLGEWGPMHCNRACQLWATALHMDGIKVRVLGGHYDPSLVNEIDRATWAEDPWEYVGYHSASSSHTWLEVEGLIVDPTAGQFGERPDFLEHYYPYNYWEAPYVDDMWQADWPALVQ